MGPVTDSLYTVQTTRALDLDRREALRKMAQLLRDSAPANPPAAQPAARRWKLAAGTRRPAAR